MKENLNKTASISFNPETLGRINDYCSIRGCSRSWLINRAVNQFFEDKEDYEAAALAWKEHEASGGKTYTAEEARKELGL